MKNWMETFQLILVHTHLRHVCLFVFVSYCKVLGCERGRWERLIGGDGEEKGDGKTAPGRSDRGITREEERGDEEKKEALST